MDEKIKYLEDEFNSNYNNVRRVASYLYDIEFGTEEDVDESKKEFSKYWTHELLHRMYNILCVYFETLKLTDYLQNFKATFEEIINNQEDAIKFDITPLEYGDTNEDLSLLIEWKKFLIPFSFFGSYKTNKDTHKLIDFLKCTNEILKITKTKVVNEESINSVIRQVAKFYFNDVITYSEGYFVHTFKNYRPDIIIKEVKTAVEYKLIRNDKDISDKIDELIIDAKRYSDNVNNRHCIAVFCLSKSVTKTKKEIKEDWTKTAFPKNWELIIINDVEIG